MNEIKRIYSKRTVLMVIAGLIIIQLIMYFYTETEFYSVKALREYAYGIENVLEEGFKETLTREELERGVEYDEDGNAYNLPENYEYNMYLINLREYQTKYEGYYNTIINNAQHIIAAIDENDKYTIKNINKTVEDYSDIKGIELELGYNQNVISFTDYKLTDYLILIFLAVIVISFFEDRKKGLSYMVRATKKGRFSLAINRILTLAASSIAASVVLYGVLFLCTTYIYGGDNSRVIQSVEAFKECDRAITITQFFVEYVMIKALVMFMVSLLMYMGMTLWKNMGMVIVTLAIILGSQYFMYENITYNSTYNLFKFLNIFSFIDTKNLYSTYYNISLFGKPIGIRELLIVGVIIMIWLIIAIVIINTIAYNCIEITAFAYIKEKWLRLKDKCLKYRSINNWEIRKIFTLNKGILVVIVFAVFIAGMISTVNTSAGGTTSTFKEKYYKSHNNEVDSEILLEISEVREAYINAELAEMDAYDEYMQGKITWEEYETVVYKCEKEASRCKLYEAIADDVKYIEKLKTETGIDGKLISQTCYDCLLGSGETNTKYKNCIVLLIACIFIGHGVFSSENQSGFISVIRATGKGRMKSFNAKLLMVSLITAVMSIALFAVEYYNVWCVYGMNNLDAPVQSIQFLMHFPFEISINTFLVIWYLLRLSVVIAAVMIVMCISLYAKNNMQSLWISIGVFVLPAFLTYIGVEGISYLSVLKPMWLMEIWLMYGFEGAMPYIALLVIWLIGIVSYIMLRKKYIVHNLTYNTGGENEA